jgi:hypothetical protein
MNQKKSRNKLKNEKKELNTLLKETKRPANRLFFEARLNEIELLLNPKIGSSNSYGIAKIY